MRLKNRVFFLALAVLFAVGLLAPAQPAHASTSVSVTFFYDSLAPYGDWVTVSSYGRCWRPAHIAATWQPYLDGEWMYTDAGWTWVSFDPWGGDPYHYGTWISTAEYGWIWIPGTIWAPAWVTWYVTDDAFGWAPVPPTFIVGISGYAGPAVTVSRSAYVFVPARQFAGVNVSTVRVPATQNATFIARSRPLTRFAVQSGVLTSGGPALPQVERVAGRRIQRVRVAEAKTQPVPIRTSLQRGQARVVVPASERARLITAHEKRGPAQVSRTSPATSEKAIHPPPQTSNGRHERTVHPTPAPAPPSNGKHERTAHNPPPPPPPQHERHEKTGSQAQANSGRQQTNAGREAHQTVHVEKQTQRPPPAHVEKQANAQPKPQGPPPAHANPPGKEKEKEKEKEK